MRRKAKLLPQTSVYVAAPKGATHFGLVFPLIKPFTDVASSLADSRSRQADNRDQPFVNDSSALRLLFLCISN